MQSKFTQLKSFGQHFLKSDERAKQIVSALPLDAAEDILEIGPGLGILSKHLLQLNKNIYFSEIDKRIIGFLKNDLHVEEKKILEGDFLRMDLKKYFRNQFLVVGNFPYGISSQILFTVLDYKEQVPGLVGMFQKEMAQRVAAKHGNKVYGVITVLLQAYYDVEYLFELKPEEFDPPPKVHSAVIRIKRRSIVLACDEKLFKQIVKAGFNQRRKKLSNSLSSIPNAKEILMQLNFADKRAEQLSVEDFILLTQLLQS